MSGYFDYELDYRRSAATDRPGRGMYFDYDGPDKRAVAVVAEGAIAYFVWDTVCAQASGRGRPPLGPKLAQRLDGSHRARARLEVMLETIAGQCSAKDACTRLGIGRAAFQRLRSRALQAACHSLEPRPVGRPRHRPTPTSRRIAELEQEVKDLKLQLKAAQVREEIAVVMPYLLKPARVESKKGAHRTAGRRRKANR